MNTVPKTKQNLHECRCIACPSYSLTCKLRAMPGNMIILLGDMEKIHAETLFCAYEKSHCISSEEGCLCPECQVAKDYNLDKRYFCIYNDGTK